MAFWSSFARSTYSLRVTYFFSFDDVNSNKLGSTVAKRNEKLVKLLNGVGEMKLGDVKDHSIDAFGDAYDASTVGFPNQEIDKYPADAVLQERLFEFMLEGKRWYDLRRFGDSYVLDYTPAEPARLLWPINQGALTNNPLLKQTVGY